jgi:hypothetical protein
MKKTIALLLFPMLLISFLCFTGCTGCKHNEAKKIQKQVEEKQVKEIQGQIKENVYPLPSSAEVIKMLSDLDVGYQIGITNPSENAKKYLRSNTRAINMGVFGADLSYVTLYNIPQEVINFLNSIRSLANELNMAKIYDESLYEKIKQNYDNKEELVKILTSAFNDTYVYLSDNEQQALALLVVGGAWIEGMYLTCHVTYAAYQFAGISKNLLEQKHSFEIYLDITKPYLSDPNLNDFVNKLEPIKTVYAGLTTSLTSTDIANITKAIEGVRNDIVLQ